MDRSTNWSLEKSPFLCRISSWNSCQKSFMTKQWFVGKGYPVPNALFTIWSLFSVGARSSSSASVLHHRLHECPLIACYRCQHHNSHRALLLYRHLCLLWVHGVPPVRIVFPHTTVVVALDSPFFLDLLEPLVYQSLKACFAFQLNLMELLRSDWTN